VGYWLVLGKTSPLSSVALTWKHYARGLTVESRLAGTFTLPVRATEDPSGVGPVDLILFCVKTYDTDAAAESIRPLIHPETMLLSLQNGVDNEEHIARVAGHDSGIGAVAYVTSTIKALGVVAQTSGPGRSYWESWPGERVRA
jgi:2-dehydropantoate 2-reductase